MEIDRGFWDQRKVVITGGAGFIGSSLARRLSDLYADVTIIDSLIPEYGGNLFNLSGYEDKIRINLSDIRDKYSLQVLLNDKSVLFNLAGQTSHMDSMLDPNTDLEINCAAQLSLLEICRRVNPGIHIVYASTRQLYGRPAYLPVDESHPVKPVDINGINKLSGELYHSLYYSVHGVRSTILRLTNTIGPRMRICDSRQTFLGIWIRNLIEGKPIEVWGGNQLRDFNDVEDVVDAMLLVASKPEAGLGPYNLGSNNVVSLLTLANQMIEIYGNGSVDIHSYPEQRKKIDIGDYYSCYKLIHSVTGWEPKHCLASTLSRTLDYYRDNINEYI